MEAHNKKICRLCLDIIKKKNFEMLEELRAEMLGTVLNNFNPVISYNPIICGNCNNSLQQCYDFKMVCLNNQVNLKHIRELFAGGKKRKGKKMCSLCFSLNSGYLANVNVVIEDKSVGNMLMSCIPELNLDMTNEPSVCQPCIYMLKRQLIFMQHCLKLEEKINLYCKLKCKDNYDIVDLYDVRQFYEKMQTENSSDRYIPTQENEANPPTAVEFIDVENVEMKVEDNSANVDTYRKEENMNLQNSAVEESTNTVEEQINTNSENSSDRYIPMQENEANPPTEVEFIDVEMKVKYNSENVDTYRKEENMNLQNSAVEESTNTVEEQINTNSENSSDRYIPTQENEANPPTAVEFIDVENVEMKVEDNSENIDTYRKEENMNLQNSAVEESTNTVEEQINTKSDITDSEKKFNCSKCIFTTKYRYDLKMHMIIHKNPSELQMFKCSICTYESKRKSDLKTHMYTHSTEPFKCKYCPFESKSFHTVTKHMGIHTAKHSQKHESPSKKPMFQCVSCKYATHNKQDLTKHFLVHKDIPENELFTCYTCNYKCKRKSTLIYHMLQHNNPSEVVYKCEQCSYTTRMPRYFKNHLTCHKDLSEVQTFSCTVCSFQTRRKQNITNHMFQHSEVVHKCEKCSYFTKTPRNLNNHIKRHHS